MSAADLIGREIRYGAIPPDGTLAKVVTGMQDISVTRIADIEKARNDVEALTSEYARRISGLGMYEDDDTVPHELVEAQEAAARIDELKEQILESDRTIRDGLRDLKKMFDARMGGS